MKDRKDAMDLWDFDDGIIKDFRKSIKQNENPYRRKPEYVIQPFPKHPDFKIVYISGTNTIIFEPCNIAMSVAHDDQTNKAANPLCAPKDWRHWQQHYFKYLPVWNDMVVGGSKWRNNTHAELGNRERKHFLRRMNRGQPMRLDMYLHTIIPGNMAIQMFWQSMVREKGATGRVKNIKEQKKLHGPEDKWGNRHQLKSDEPAYSATSIGLCNSYSTFINQNNLTNSNITRKTITDALNGKLKQWKEVQLKAGYTRFGNNGQKFSDEVVRCLHNGLELGQIRQPKIEMFQFFFNSVNY